MSSSTTPVGCRCRLPRHGGITPGRLGEVMVAVGGGVQAYLARDADDGTIPPLAEVLVVDRVGPRTVLVTPDPTSAQEPA